MHGDAATQRPQSSTDLGRGQQQRRSGKQKLLSIDSVCSGTCVKIKAIASGRQLAWIRCQVSPGHDASPRHELPPRITASWHAVFRRCAAARGWGQEGRIASFQARDALALFIYFICPVRPTPRPCLSAGDTRRVRIPGAARTAADGGPDVAPATAAARQLRDSPTRRSRSPPDAQPVPPPPPAKNSPRRRHDE